MITKRKPAGKYYAIVFFLIFLACIRLSFSGSIIIKPGSGRINGLGPRASVEQGQAVKLCYTVESGYLYTGYQRQEYAYVVFTLETEIDIKGSVGRGADNLPEDVRLIKGILYSLYSISLERDQSVDDTFIATIERFQKSIPINSVDGRIDKNGATLKALRIGSAESFFVKLFKTTVSTQHNQQGIGDCVSFMAPSQTKKYKIRYNNLPIILAYTIGKEIDINGQTITRLNSNEENMVRAHAIRYWSVMEDIAEISVVPEGDIKKPPYANYLRLYGEIPGLKSIPTGYSENTVLFTWESRPRPGGDSNFQSIAGSIEYRYQLYPDQDSWSAWGKGVEAEYYFIERGTHRFEVESRYKDETGVIRNVPSTAYEFILEKAFVSEPKVIHKGSGGQTPKPIPDKNTIYNKSKALLIGVTKFQDPRLPPLAYASNDVAKMREGLRNVGFTDITDLVGEVTREQIISSIDKMVTEARPNDRLIIYFSSHGFQDRINKLRAYVAAYDTNQDQPNVNGIAFSQIEEMLQRALRNNVKHLLIILDTCCSGLGTIIKSPAYMELSTIATEPGAHMITAGTEEESAEMDLTDKMSTFTKYFVEGLSQADYTKDTVITLTELLLYVRFQVGKQTKGAQTPRLGCIQGPGEMVFFLH